MPIQRFRNISKIGVVSDAIDIDLPVNAWTDANNVRFDSNKVINIKGYDILSANTCIQDQTPLVVQRSPMAAGQYFYASDRFIYSVFNDPSTGHEARYNVTPRDVGGIDVPAYDVNTDIPTGTKVAQFIISDSQRWNTCVIAGRVVINSPQYIPYSQKDGTVDPKEPFVSLKNWGIPRTTGPDAGKQLQWHCDRLKTYKDHLMALNMTESVSFDTPATTANIPNRVRWSNYAFENQVPQGWYEDAVDQEGGFVDLMEATSPIRDGATLRDYFMVYTNTETYLFSYVGGVDVFANELLFADSGILAPGCVVEYNGVHVVVTQDDIIAHDGSQKLSIVQGVIKERLFKEISSVNAQATRVFANPTNREVWVCYPYAAKGDSDATRYYMNRAAIYSMDSKTWTFTDLPDIFDAQMGQVDRPDATAPLSDPWDGGTVPIDTSLAWDALPALSWTVQNTSVGDSKFIAASHQNCIYVLDYTSENYKPVFSAPTTFVRTSQGFPVCFVERTGIDFDEVVDDYVTVKTWKKVQPQLGGEGEFNVIMKGFNVPFGLAYDRPATVYTVGVDYKVDCLWTYRFPGIRVESTKGATWAFNGYDVDFVVEGTR